MITMRPANPEERDWLFKLHRTTMHELVEQVWGWDDAVQQRFFQNHLAAGNHSVIEQNGEIIGTVQIHRHDDHIFIGNIEIDPAFQGIGIGSEIIRSLMAEANASGHPVCLQVLKVNDRARRLYERLGFVITESTETHHRMTTSVRAARDSANIFRSPA